MRSILLVCFTIFLLGTLLYSNTFHAGFYFDDHVAIVGNPAIRDLGNLRAIWDAFHTRVIAGLSFALNYALGKLNPFGYHLLNITCHLLSSLLIYVFVVWTLKTPSMVGSPLAQHDREVAVVASLIFLVHPIQTQAVNYLWQRVTCLATLFYLASLVLYARARLKRSLTAYLGAWGTTLLAMFTKEIAFTLPVTILLYEFFFFGPREGKGRQKYRWALPFLLTLFVIPSVWLLFDQTSLELMRFPSLADASGKQTVFGSLSHLTRWNSRISLSRQDYFWTQLKVLRTYLRLLGFPVHQNLYYDYPPSHHFTDPGVLGSLFLLIGVIVLGVQMFRKERLASFGIFWFLTTVSVESLVVLPDVIFEHRLYLPLVGFSLFLSSSLFSLMKHARSAVLVSSLLVFVFSGATYRRNEVWKDEISLWRDTLQKSPGKARPYCALGDVYRRKGDLDTALAYYHQAIALDPAYVDAHNNIGIIYSQKGLPEKAMASFRKAIRLNPAYAKAYNNLGVLYAERGHLSTAASCYQKALARNPTYDEAYRNLGTVYGQRGHDEEALACYAEAIRLNPTDARTYTDVGVIYGRQGRSRHEIAYYQKAIALDTTQTAAHLNLGIACMEQGDRACVLKQVETLRELGRGDLAGRLEKMVQ